MELLQLDSCFTIKDMIFGRGGGGGGFGWRIRRLLGGLDVDAAIPFVGGAVSSGVSW